MCGIVGVIHRDPRKQIQASRLTAARDAMIHRGPDEQGLWIKPGAALGHRRLKILDLTRGQQPMLSADERFALVYNGEIYNFRQLQADYAGQGAHFETQCDTEVLLHALNTDGRAALDRFNGMFAFAHWDHTQRQLLLARDRMGQKPLYWCADDQKLAFASELKALLILLDQQFELDVTAIDQFFARGYILSPRTIFQDVHKLPAGCLLTLDANHWRFDVEPYWDVEPIETPGDENAVIDELEELLSDAVRLRLVSDVPIGCLLSGGIDSSLITALAAKVSPDPVKTFSIGFDESESLNELPYAQMVAKHCRCDSRSRMVRADDFERQMSGTAAFFDEPFANFAMFPSRQLAQLAREELVVVLSGQGGDELTAGYPGRYNWVTKTQPMVDAGQRQAYSAPVDDVVQYLNHISFAPWTGARDQVFSRDFQAKISAQASPFDEFEPFWSRRSGDDRLNRVLYTDVKTNLADYLICVEERATMSCSLEARNPLLDHRVVNYLLSLPASMKLRNGENKWVLKQLAYRHAPREAIDRPKRGFTPPLQQWIHQAGAALTEIFRETDAQTRGFYSDAWRKCLLNGQHPPQAVMLVFYSLMFALWTKQYGKYVANWPSAGESNASIAVAPGAGNPWQQAFRVQRAPTLSAARWFTQAMRNFPEGSHVHLIGDVDGWHARLAQQCGLETVEESSAEGVVILNASALTDYLDSSTGSFQIGVDQTVLLFVPVNPINQSQVEQVMAQFNARAKVQGGQLAPLGDGEQVLIVRAQAAEAPAPVIKPMGDAARLR